MRNAAGRRGSNSTPAVGPDLPLSRAVDAFKEARIREALERAGGSRTRAARLLGMRQSNLSRPMASLGMREREGG